MRFADMLAAARGERSLAEMERLSGVPASNLFGMLDGSRYPSPVTLAKLAAALPIDFDRAAVAIWREKAGLPLDGKGVGNAPAQT